MNAAKTPRSRPSTRIAAVASLALLGCATAQEPALLPATAVAQPAAVEEKPEESLVSNAGTYRVFYGAAPRIVLNEPFTMQVQVRDAAGTKTIDAAELIVTAAMPEHGHGMLRTPEVRSLGNGAFEVQGMLLHMAGRWEVYFDVAEGPTVERAQFGVQL
jgi:hypothetical protein